MVQYPQTTDNRNCYCSSQPWERARGGKSVLRSWRWYLWLPHRSCVKTASTAQIKISVHVACVEVLGGNKYPDHSHPTFCWLNSKGSQMSWKVGDAVHKLQPLGHWVQQRGMGMDLRWEWNIKNNQDQPQEVSIIILRKQWQLDLNPGNFMAELMP